MSASTLGSCIPFGEYVASGTRQSTELTLRRAKVMDLYLKGESQPAIARKLKLSQPTVSRDLEHCREEWKARAAEDFKAHVAESLARVDRLELEAWRAWERSVGTHKKRVEKSEPTIPAPTQETMDPLPAMAPVDAVTEVTVTTEKLNGDPRYLERIAGCIDRRIKLLGLDAPKRVDVTSGGMPIVKAVSPEVLEAI